MPFFLDGNPTQGEISEAINYLLGNFSQSVTADPSTGQITGPTGGVQAYLYRYLQVKYADSFDGSVGFSNTPTNKGYYGLRNTDTQTPESTNPADYLWTQVTGGFGTTKLLYYTVTGGRQISIIAALAAPSALWQADSGAAIDLDVISGSDGASSRICYAKSTSTSLSGTPATYQTTGSATFPPYNTWGGSETWQATPPTLAVNEALFQSDGIYNPMTNLTTWNVPYLSNLKVGALSAITANLGSITAGSLDAVTITGSTLTIGSSPAISGTTMTGSGAKIYSDGRFALGNSSKNITFNGSDANLNGFSTGLQTSIAINNSFGTLTTIGTATVTKTGIAIFNCNGYYQVNDINTSAFPNARYVNGSFTFYLKNSSGTTVATMTSSSSGAMALIAGAPIVTPWQVIWNTPFGLSTQLTLTPDTYTVQGICSGTLYDSSGANLGNASRGGLTGTAFIFQVAI